MVKEVKVKWSRRSRSHSQFRLVKVKVKMAKVKMVKIVKVKGSRCTMWSTRPRWSRSDGKMVNMVKAIKMVKVDRLND